MQNNADAPVRRKVTPPQFAKQYGVSTAKVLAWIASGELRAINAATRPTGERPRWLIDLADVEAFERSRASVAPKPATTRRRRAAKQSSVTTYF
jgi:transposase